MTTSCRAFEVSGMKPRHHLYFDEQLTEQLEALASKPETSKSAIVSDALRAYLTRRASRELDDMLKIRLDRISNQLARIERDDHVLLESLALFIRYQLTISAPLPEADAAGRALGRDRFEAFVAQVGRQLAGGKRSLAPEAGDQ
jgi:predicted transcriptional regulator